MYNIDNYIKIMNF